MSSDTRMIVTGEMPIISVAQAVDRYNQMVEFVRTIMKEGIDYGIIPGVNKPSLWKPGAEKLCTFFGLRPLFQEVHVIEDWNGAVSNGEPFFYYKVKCQLMRDGVLISECLGSCNSFEEKYRFRKASRTCPQCGKETIIKGKVEYGGGFVCFAKKGGCGYKYQDNDPRITSQEIGKVKNEQVFDLVNTILKQAEKRAFVGATLLGVNGSEFFTQDVEDIVYDGYAPVVEGGVTTNQSAHAQTNGNQPASSQPTIASTPPTTTGQEFTEGVLTYKMDGLVKLVKVAIEDKPIVWKPAGKQVTLSEETKKLFASLFDNEHHLKNHLKSNFESVTLATLTWEELMAVWECKKNGKKDPRWYKEKEEVTNNEIPKFAEIREAYYGGALITSADDDIFLEKAAQLPDPLCLKKIEERYSRQVNDDVTTFTSLAVLLLAGDIVFDTPEFWSTCDAAFQATVS